MDNLYKLSGKKKQLDKLDEFGNTLISVSSVLNNSINELKEFNKNLDSIKELESKIDEKIRVYSGNDVVIKDNSDVIEKTNELILESHNKVNSVKDSIEKLQNIISNDERKNILLDINSNIKKTLSFGGFFSNIIINLGQILGVLKERPVSIDLIKKDGKVIEVITKYKDRTITDKIDRSIGKTSFKTYESRNN